MSVISQREDGPNTLEDLVRDILSQKYRHIFVEDLYGYDDDDTEVSHEWLRTIKVCRRWSKMNSGILKAPGNITTIKWSYGMVKTRF